MNATTRVKLQDIIPALTCSLCKGYFVDATTIIECLHSYCKSCIIKHLEKSEYCPVCDVQLHSSKPLSSIRSDQMLQEIVYKLVPGLFQNEMERRRQFYKDHPESVPKSQLDAGQVYNESYISSDDIINLTLEYETTDTKIRQHTKRYVKCPAAVSVSILKKLLRNKYDVPAEAHVEVLYGERVQPDDFLLMDIAYKYSWTQNSNPLQLFFRFKGDPSLFKLIKFPPPEPEAKSAVTPVAAPGKLKPLNSNVKPKKSLLKSSTVPKTTTGSPSIPLIANSMANGILHGKSKAGVLTTNVTPTSSPGGAVRGRRKKKSLDTEQELNKLFAAVTGAELKEKEVQLRISENGVMSARNVNSGEEKILSSTNNTPPPNNPQKGSHPLAVNGLKAPHHHLHIPQIVVPTIGTKSSLIPKALPNGGQSKFKALAPSISPALSLTPTTGIIIGKKQPPGKLLKKSEAALKMDLHPNKISSNMENLTAVTIKLKEERERQGNYFSAEITPINGTPPPKLVTPKEAQKYPAATLHTTTELPPKATKNASSPYNKRLHQTTIINGDVKFTKNLLPPAAASPTKIPKLAATTTKAMDSPKQQQQILSGSPCGSPNKPPKFFKSRHNNLDQSSPVPNLKVPFLPGEDSSSSSSSAGESPPKKVRIMDPQQLPATSTTPLVSLVTSSSNSPMAGTTPNQPPPNNNNSPSVRFPTSSSSAPIAMNVANIPMNLVHLFTNPAFGGPLPIFSNPFYNFQTQMQSLTQNMSNVSAYQSAVNNGMVPPTASYNGLSQQQLQQLQLQQQQQLQHQASTSTTNNINLNNNNVHIVPKKMDTPPDPPSEPNIQNNKKPPPEKKSNNNNKNGGPLNGSQQNGKPKDELPVILKSSEALCAKLKDFNNATTGVSASTNNSSNKAPRKSMSPAKIQRSGGAPIPLKPSPLASPAKASPAKASPAKLPLPSPPRQQAPAAPEANNPVTNSSSITTEAPKPTEQSSNIISVQPDPARPIAGAEPQIPPPPPPQETVAVVPNGPSSPLKAPTEAPSSAPTPPADLLMPPPPPPPQAELSNSKSPEAKSENNNDPCTNNNISPTKELPRPPTPIPPTTTDHVPENTSSSA